MRILEVTGYSAGICGVFARVKQESILLAEKGHTVAIFSSNFIKGKDGKERAPSTAKLANIEIKRFPAKKLGGESFMQWDYTKEAKEFKPDVIIAHGYRHTHTTRAACIAKELKIPVFLVTHAPFARDRGAIASAVVWFYDKFIGRKTLPDFTKIIAITHWERPYLHNLGVEDSKIEYIPNGLAKEFFTHISKTKPEHKMLFLGRVAPIKNIEVVLNALPLVADKELIFEIVGPAEEDYANKIKELAKTLNIEKRIKWSDAITDVHDKINKIDSAKLFILPSHSEGMPQSLVEAMARTRIVIGSNNLGISDLIKDGSNGFLFPITDHAELAKVIDKALSLNAHHQTQIRHAARVFAQQFDEKLLIKKLEDLFS